MAKPRTPTNVLELTGAYAKNPKRRRPPEPEPRGEIGDAPVHLKESEKATWRELVALAHEGTLCQADRLHVEHVARLLAYVRSLERYDDPQLFLRLESGLAKLGMTPADRSRVAVIPRRQPNPFDAFR